MFDQLFECSPALARYLSGPLVDERRRHLSHCAEKVSEFLAGQGPLTASWHVGYNALLGFYRYAISRGFVAASPLPLVIAKRPPAFQPYICSQTELRLLLDSTASYQRYRSRLEPSTWRAILLLMYGAALRTSEALSLTIRDVDLANAALTVRDSKFFKSRLVSLGMKTVQILAEYPHRRATCGYPVDRDASFFMGRNARRVNIFNLEQAFR
jgi:site-specific recombinase XerD